jgi:hypothetical protein
MQAAGMEAAAGRDMERTGNLTGEDDFFAVYIGKGRWKFLFVSVTLKFVNCLLLLV